MLKEDQQMAFISKEIATIYRDVPLMVQDLEDIRYQKQESEELTDLFKELEFYLGTHDIHIGKHTHVQAETCHLKSIDHMFKEER